MVDIAKNVSFPTSSNNAGLYNIAAGGVSNISDFFAKKQQEEEANKVAHFTNALEQAKYAGNTEAMKSMLGYSGFTNPENQLKAQGLVRSALDTTQEGLFNQALSKATRIGDFTGLEEQIAGIGDTAKKQAALSKLNTAFDTHRKAGIELGAITGSVADIDNQIAKVQNDSTIPVPERVALIKSLEAQRGINAPKEVLKTGLGAISTAQEALKAQERTGLAEGLIATGTQNDIDYSAIGQNVNKYFNEINGRLVPIDPSELVQRQQQEALTYAGNDTTKYEAKLEEIIKRDDQAIQSTKAQLNELFTPTRPEDAALSYLIKPVDLGSAQDAILKNAAASAATAGLDAQQTDAILTNLKSLAARQFKLGDEKTADLQGRIAANTEKANTQIEKQKKLDDLTSKMSEAELQAVATATGGSYKDVATALKEIPGEEWFKWGGEREEAADAIMKVIGSSLSISDGKGGTIDVVPNPQQITLAMETAPEGGWFSDGKFMRPDVFKKNLTDIVTKQVGSSAPIRKKYTDDQIDRINKFYKFQQDVKARLGAENLAITQRTYADEKLPYEQRNLGKSALDIFNGILKNVSDTLIPPAAAADIPGVANNVPGATVKEDVNSTAATSDKYKNKPDLAIYDAAIEKQRKAGNKAGEMKALELKLFTLNNTKGPKDKETIATQLRLKSLTTEGNKAEHVNYLQDVYSKLNIPELASTVKFNDSEVNLRDALIAMELTESGKDTHLEAKILGKPIVNDAGISSAKGPLQTIPQYSIDWDKDTKNIFEVADDMGITYPDKSVETATKLLTENNDLGRRVGTVRFIQLYKKTGDIEKALKLYLGDTKGDQWPNHLAKFKENLNKVSSAKLSVKDAATKIKPKSKNNKDTQTPQSKVKPDIRPSKIKQFLNLE